MKYLFLHGFLLLSFLFSFSVSGQPAKEFSSFGRNIYSNSLGNVFGGFRNEAGLTRFKHFTAGVLAERRFMLDATSIYAFAAAVPLSQGVFSIQGLGSGYKNFSRQRLALAYGMPLFSWLNAGLQLDYMNMHIPLYGSAHAFTFGLSFFMHLHDHWTLGVQTFNPAEVKYNSLGEDIIPSSTGWD